MRIEEIDKIYVIGLRNRWDRRQKINQTLNNLGIQYEIIDAWNAKLPKNRTYYHEVIDGLKESGIVSDNFLKWTFQPGALGCLLSHLKVIQDANAKNYEKIIVLEDDILVRKNFITEFESVTQTLPGDWDFVYLGKKQGGAENPDQSKIENVNDHWYVPNDKTWASHAWMIRNTVYQSLIDKYSKLDNAVDNMARDLIGQYKFYCIDDDLFITPYDSDIRKFIKFDEKNHYQKWGWDINKYYTEPQNIRQIIIWGFEDATRKNHTHTYIHKNVYSAFQRLYPTIPVRHLTDDSREEDYSHTLFFCSPTHGDVEHLPILDNCVYIIHIDDAVNNLGDDEDVIVGRFQSVIQDNRALLLKCRIYGEDRISYFTNRGNTICLPWAVNSDNEFNILRNYYKLDNNFNKVKNEDRCILYFGSIWKLNLDLILKIAKYCRDKGYVFKTIGRINSVNFKQLKEVNPDTVVIPYYKYKEEDNFEKVLSENRFSLVLSVQGEEHSGSYLSCRLFSNISAGYLGLSNNSLSELVDGVVFHENIEELIESGLDMIRKPLMYKRTLAKQMLDVYFHHTYLNRVMDYVQQLNRITIHGHLPWKIPHPADSLNKTYLLILSFQRSGSSFLCDILDRFQNIQCHQELFQAKKVGISNKISSRLGNDLSIEFSGEELYKHEKMVTFRESKHPIQFLQYLEDFTLEDFVGLKVFPDNVLQIAYIYQMMQHPKFIPIILKRKFLDVYISWKRASRTQFADFDYSNMKIKLVEWEYEKLHTLYQQWYQNIEKYLQQNSIPHYYLDYQNIDGNPEYVVSLLENMGLDIGPVNQSLVRAKQDRGNHSYEDKIENYHDIKHLIQT